MNAAIQVEHLSKVYQLGEGAPPSYRMLRDSITDGITGAWRGLRRRFKPPISASNDARTHWALNDVSCEIQPGEVVGIVGRNGAGKSTLLKILGRITQPTSGRAIFRGRIGSLLEVGTGFHKELTGRENIYLNGAILGMSRREIDRKFDEIVDFAEIERFLDTPAKRYSSGMYVRLAFAVAAHLEPEILLVDEVLAVGDAEFQKKCLGKMDHIAKGGRTVLFVSHQMSAVQRLCKQCLFLERGKLKAFGSKDEIIAQYLADGNELSKPGVWIDLTKARRTGSQQARFVGMRMSCPDELVGNHPYPDSPFEIQLSIESDEPRRVSSLAATFCDRYGTVLVNADTVVLGETLSLDRQTTVLLRIKELHLNPGTYTLGLCLAYGRARYDQVRDVIEIEVVDPPSRTFGARSESPGAVTCNFSVKINPGIDELLLAR
jgi:lipopolysaccharide transport system ATP-binding protein